MRSLLPARIRDTFIALVVAGSFLPAVIAGPIASAATTTTLTPVRTIGGPGHAELYGWGMATLSDGSVLVGDYWNFRIAHYSVTGQYLGDVVDTSTRGPDPGEHQSPYGIAVDPRNDDVYFGDVDAGKTVDKYSADGDLILEFGGNGTGPGRYQYPSQVSVASDGRVFVSDQWDHTVVAVSPTGQELFEFGGMGTGNGQFRQPRGSAVDANDNLYVVDNYNGRVQVFDRDGTYLRQFGSKGTGPGQFGTNPDLRGAAIDKENGWIYVVDASRSLVNKYTLQGQFLLSFGGYGGGLGKFPGGGRNVTVDGNGNVWVGDMPSFRAQVFSPQGQFLFAVPQQGGDPPEGGFNQPRGVSVDSAGNVYVTDTHNWRVQKFAPNGTFLQQWGSRGGGAYSFNYQRGISVDLRDDAFVLADTDNHKIKKYSSSGEFLWGIGGFGTNLGQFRNPHSLDVGPNGTIAVADTQNQRVVLVSPDGQPLSSFGSAGSGNGQFRFPRSVVWDTDGTLWVSDSLRGDVQHFTSGGAFLGRIATANNGEDDLLRAADVEVDAENVYVADVDAHRVKVWTRDGAFVGAFGGPGNGSLLRPHGMEIVGDRLYVVEQSNERVTEFRIETGVGGGDPDTTPPDGSVTTPTKDQTFTSVPAGLSGEASDDIGVDHVRVAIQDRVSKAWLRANGTWGAFQNHQATLASPGAATTGWSYAFTPPAGGSGRYTVQVAAVDAAGNVDPTKPWVPFEVAEGGGGPTDETPPNGTVAVPTNDQEFASTPVALSGAASDDVGVEGVRIAIRDRASGEWLRSNGAWGAFQNLEATLAAPGATWTGWTFGFSPAPGGSGLYAVQVTAVDTSGNDDPTKPWLRFSTT